MIRGHVTNSPTKVTVFPCSFGHTGRNGESSNRAVDYRGRQVLTVGEERGRDTVTKFLSTDAQLGITSPPRSTGGQLFSVSPFDLSALLVSLLGFRNKIATGFPSGLSVENLMNYHDSLLSNGIVTALYFDR